MLLAMTQARLGRLEEAKSAASRLLALQPGYTVNSMCVALPLDPGLAKDMSEALHAAGLPA